MSYHAATCPADTDSNANCTCGLWRVRVKVLEDEVVRLRLENEALQQRVQHLQHLRH
jgi:hypothetical protein